MNESGGQTHSRYMKRNSAFSTLGLASGAAFLSLVSSTGCSRAVAQSAAPERSAISLTIYKDDFAMVHDERDVELQAGSTLLHLAGVSKHLDPSSVLFDWPGGGPRPEVASMTYNVGLGCRSK